MSEDTLDSLAEARVKIEAARKALRPVLDGQGELAPLVARLDRMTAEVTRIEGVVAEQMTVAGTLRALQPAGAGR